MDERPAGWQPDPTGRHEHRYWDGAAWTAHVSDAGVRSEEPAELVPPAPQDVDPVAAVEPEPEPEPTPEPVPAPEPEPVPVPEPVAVVEAAPVVEPAPPVRQGAPSEPPRSGRRRLLTALVVVLALGGAALAIVLTKDDDPSSPVAGQIRSAFDEVTDQQADCLADKVEAALSEKQLTGLALDKPNPGPAEEQALTAIANGLSACGAAQATPTTQGPDGGAGTTSTTLDEAGYRKQLATFYVGMLDATQEQAECLAGAVIAAGKEAERTSSTIPELSTFFDGCHIDHASPVVTSP